MPTPQRDKDAELAEHAAAAEPDENATTEAHPGDPEDVAGPEMYSVARLLGPDGPEILRVEHHVIVGALFAEHQKLRANPDAKVKDLSRGDALVRIDKWLRTPVQQDNSLHAAEDAA